jgi:hypothetical protein
MLHARALGLLLDGKPDEALPLLRVARKADPSNELVAFDLARVGRAHGGIPEDLRAVLTVEPTTAATRLMQAYVLLDGGDAEGALSRVEAVLAAEPDHAEAAELRKILQPGAPAPSKTGLEVERKIGKKEPQRFTGRVRLAGVADSNVTVLPEDAPSHQAGYRLQVDAAALVNLARGDLTADAGAAFLYGPHLNDRAASSGQQALSELDVGAAVALVTLEHRTRVLVWDLDAAATEVFLDSFGTHYMQDFGAQMSARLLMGSAELGLYGAGGYRDYVGLNEEGSRFDRDGARAAGGLVLEWKAGGGFGLDVHAGYQLELAAGKDVAERGPEARLMLRWHRGDIGVRGGVAYMMRDYFDRSAGNERTDQRITPRIEVRYSITDWLGVRGSYALTRNFSEASADYTRHLGQLGVEATW